MKRKRFSVEQIVGLLMQFEVGVLVANCGRANFYWATYLCKRPKITSVTSRITCDKRSYVYYNLSQKWFLGEERVAGADGSERN